MAKGKGRGAHHLKAINLALQGGGAHGAFTWGVLDRLFEEDPLWVEALSGTSAGAMNAVVAAQGMYEGGATGAREALHEFWWRVSQAGALSPIKRTPLNIVHGNWSLDNSPAYLWFDMMSRMTSPYDLNIFDYNPLRDLVEDFVDLSKIAGEHDMEIFLSATNVQSGQVRVFRRAEITYDVIMASACLPFMFKAVEIDGCPYWDGGYMGNPVLFPFIEHSPSADILIVQINPMHRPGTPNTAREILNRVNEITFNSSLLQELWTINLIDRLLDEGKLSAKDFRHMRLHMIDGEAEMLALDASSKLNAEWAFLTHLRDVGRRAADGWLAAHFDDIEVRSSMELDRLLPKMGTPLNCRPANVTELKAGE
ncbi:MAG: patatin-like phospholipase family protein [Pseudomonadota bacterium]